MAKKRIKKVKKSSAKKKVTSSQSASSSSSTTPTRKRTSQSTIPPHLITPLTHVGFIVGAMVLIFIYFQPVLEGQSLQMSDVQQFAGMSSEVRAYAETTGEQALWTTAIFGGMPTFHLGVKHAANWWNSIRNAYFSLVPNPVSFILLHFLGFYLLLNVMGMKPSISAIGAFAFAFSSYFFIILKAGHSSKAAAIGFMAPILAGIIITYRGKWLLGATLVAIFTALEIASNHFQVTYYLLIVIFVLAVAYFIEALREKQLPQFAKASGILLLAGLLGVGPNVGMLWTTSEYAEETIRGRAELTDPDGDKPSSGLDKDRALMWSYGQAETFTLLIPNFHGGSSQNEVSRTSDAYQQLRSDMLPTYWGDQPFVSGPVYVGAIICFLFVLGLMTVKGPLKWGLLAATILSILLAWGKNLEWFSDIFFYNIPLYNKFRAVTIILIIAELTMPLLGMLGLQATIKRVEDNDDLAGLSKQILIAGGITGGLSLLFWLAGSALFSFSGTYDARIQQAEVLSILRDLRIDMFKADAIRAFLLIAVSAGALWLYVQNRIKVHPMLAILGVLIIGDMWTVNKRYLDSDDFGRRKNYDTPAPSPADQFILEDEDPHFRVLNLAAGDPFQNASAAFFHHCIGGYHAAKLRRYDDLISRKLQPEIQQFASALQNQPSDSSIRAAFAQMTAHNMLNARYIIINPENRPLENPLAMGNAWFVGQSQMVANADEEMAAIQNFDPQQVAIIDQHFSDQLADYNPPSNISGTLTLTDYSPNELVYTSNSNQEQLAIFSEIYYNDKKGWKAYIDDEYVPHFRANYVLRGLRVPAGDHTIVFKMQPRSYFIGETISLIASILLTMLLLGFVAWNVIQKRQALQSDTNPTIASDKDQV